MLIEGHDVCPASARNALTAATSPGRSPQRNNNRPTSLDRQRPLTHSGYSPPTAAIALACLDAIHDQVPYEVWMFLGIQCEPSTTSNR